MRSLPVAGRWLALFIVLGVASAVPAAELVRLTKENYDKYVPGGKEVDAIIGDFVLRNDKITCVIADPIPGRNANMTVRNVGGCIIDLTTNESQNDQLGCYYPGAGRFAFRLSKARWFEGGGLGSKMHETLEVTGDGLHGSSVELHLRAEGRGDFPTVEVRYRLPDEMHQVLVNTVYVNEADKNLDVEFADSIRADRTFERSTPGSNLHLAWFYDKYFRQGYGIVAPLDRITFADGGSAGVLLSMVRKGVSKQTLEPGDRYPVDCEIFPSVDLFQLQAYGAGSDGDNPLSLCAENSAGDTIPDCEVAAFTGKEFTEYYGHGYTGPDGVLKFQAPPGKYRLHVAKIGREKKTIDIDTAEKADYVVQLVDPGVVVGNITAEGGGPIPCKVQFIGEGDTPSPDFGHEAGHTAVKNLVYTHNGKFRQEIGPGKYRVVLSYGPEYDAVMSEITVERGKETEVEGVMKRVVDTAGWVSADFHNHASPSGDNVSSQFGRVQNILCEHMEFAPCTEHNRVDTYTPHLKVLGAEHLMSTCSGIELTGSPLPLNHQNAFPLVFKPHLQDGGGPTTDEDPEVQISRLALWDGQSEKLVQQNHPDLGWLFFDRDGDGKPDGGYAKSIPYMDVIEIHPLAWMLEPPTIEIQGRQENNRIFNWLQLLNQGHRITGVVNTDSHYNFHESGFWRNFIKSKTDDPAKIEVLDMVRASERGNLTMTTAPFLNVEVISADAGDKSRGIPGDDVEAPSGKAMLKVRVQCANWYDIDRVQVYFNGQPQEKLNFTRAVNPQMFADKVVKFEQELPLEMAGDTHVIVMAVGEKSTLGVVQGPNWGTLLPIAVSNPIYVDVDGGGFKANGDTLGAPLPVKSGTKPAE